MTVSLSIAGIYRDDRRPIGQRALPYLLVAPLFLFMISTFVLPIGLMLFQTFEDRVFAQAFPQTAVALARWDGKDLPDDALARTFVSELGRVRNTDTLGRTASRLNNDISGFRSLLLKTARQLPDAASPDMMAALAAIDPHWRERKYWTTMQLALGPYTIRSLLAAVDLRRDETGITSVESGQRIFRAVIVRTFWISAVVTLACLVLGYPVAYLLSGLPARAANWLLLLVLIPFWTSLLVRTVAWIVLLQEKGIINKGLMAMGIISAPLSLIYNRIGVYVALTHVLLPLMILPLYSVMKGIDPSAMRAARSLGASPVVALIRVYIPQTWAGIGAGSLLVFVSALGYYVTASLVGGAGDQMLGYFISFYTNETTNWQLAGALSIVVLTATAVVYVLFVWLERRGRPEEGEAR